MRPITIRLPTEVRLVIQAGYYNGTDERIVILSYHALAGFACRLVYLATRNPMFVFEFDGALFKLSVKTPAFVPLFQLPPRMNARDAFRPDNHNQYIRPLPAKAILVTMSQLEPDAFTTIASLETLVKMQKKALVGKRNSHSATAINYRFMSDLLQIQRELVSGEYQPMDYRRRIITEPKDRMIEAPAFRDRIVHHAIHSVLSPFYERHFIRDSYACRENKGIHKAMARVRHFLRSESDLYVCKIDISKYYASVNHGKLRELLRKRIGDKRLLNLLDVIIDSSDSGDEHDYLFAPDSYYHTKGRRGIPIGNLTSQLFANIYLHEADMFVKQTLHAKFYVRYMDDILLFHTDKAVLHEWQRKLTAFLYDELYLTVNPRKVRVYPSRLGVDFVGYVIYRDGERVRASSVRRFRRRFRRHLKGYHAGAVSEAKLDDMLNAWSAHVRHGSGEPLIRQIAGELDGHKFVAFVRNKHRQYIKSRQKPVQLPLFDD